MSKSFKEELKQELQLLKSDEADRFFTAIENHEFPALPLLPHTVLKTIRKTALAHKVTASELSSLLGITTPTASDIEILAELTRDEK